MPHSDELVWLHLSDIHFHPKTAWRDNAIRREMLEFLRDEFTNGLARPQLVFCTGDIAFGETSGAPLNKQYHDAAAFFDELLACCGLSRERLFMVPGNHDVNRREISTDQQTRLTDMASDPRKYVAGINQRFAECSRDHRSAMERLNDYGKFVKDYRPELHWEGYHLYAHTLEVNGYQVGIAGFNSAWSCAGAEDDRHVWLAGEWQFNHMAEKLREADLRIGLIHHPFDWLNEAERHDAEVRADNSLHFLLHGHTHTAWVRPSDNCAQLAAGAVGADTTDQFGINLVRLNPQNGECCAHLFSYNRGWMIQAVPRHAPAAQWKFRSSVNLARRSVVLPEPELYPAYVPSRTTSAEVSSSGVQRLFGRDKLLLTLATRLEENLGLALYGLSGNGKSTLIKALHRQTRFQSMNFVGIHCSRHMSVGEFFRRLLDVLQNRSEDPRPPSGKLEAQVTELRRRYPNAQHTFIWMCDAHLLLEGAQWCNPEIRMLMLALSLAFPSWKWVYELNEKPEEGSFGRECLLQEIPGLDKSGLAELLTGSALQGREAEWTYTGNNLRALFQWLGGGQGGTAHTLAAELLATIAREQQSTPMEVYQHLRNEVIDRLDEKLLGMLHDEVLGDAERSLIKVLALYRNAIPQDHADGLEEGLGLTDAWQTLRRRGLLPLDSNKDHYLHGFIASWVRQKQMLLCDVECNRDYADKLPTAVAEMHWLIARCWQQQIGRQKEEINFQRANEAFYHLVCANELGEVGQWIDHLIGMETGWSNDALWIIYHRYRDTKASVERQQEVLQLLVNIHPREAKAWRFLGECLQKTRGSGCDEALEAFERAMELIPQFPPYLANIGQALQARGKVGAEEFLRRMEEHQKHYPEAVNDYVQSIQNRCLELTGKTHEASLHRRQAIEDGSRNSAFYSDEAKYQLEQLDNPPEALRLLSLARDRHCADDYFEAIGAKVLEKLQRGPEASAQRMDRIEAGTRNPVFYADEAKYQLDQKNDPGKALEVLEKARSCGCDNEVIRYLHSKALQRNRPCNTHS